MEGTPPLWPGREALLPLRARRPERLFSPDLQDDIPTPLGPDEARSPIPIEPVPPSSRFRAVWTMWELLRFAWGLGRLRLTRRSDPATRAVMARQLLERLSGMWIKAGQLMSLRTDLLSEEMCRELSSLQYRVAGFPPEVARRVVAEDLGRPIEQVFAWFDPEPFAAASICQVHRATLLADNRAVVVKVMRPDVKRSFARDMRLLRSYVLVLGLLGVGYRFRLPEGLRELDSLLAEETDYRFEAVNLKRMRRVLRRHDVHVPRVVEAASGERVLVMEEVPGVLMSRYIRARREDPAALRRWEAENLIEPRTLARRLSVSTLRQILEDNEFHGDLHPGNIMLLADNRVALLDFGSVGRLDRRTFHLYRLSLDALGRRDFDRAADYMLLIQPGLGALDDRRVRRDMADALQGWELRTQLPKTSYAERSIAAMSGEVAAVMARHNVPLGWNLMRVGRCLSTLDASLQTLTPDGDFLKVSRAYFRDRAERARRPGARARAVRETLDDLNWIASDAKLALGGLLRQQALRSQGLLDTVQRVRLRVLLALQRYVWLIVILTASAMLADEHFRSLPPENRPFFAKAMEDILQFLPNLHWLEWLGCIAIGILASRLLRAARNAFPGGR